MKKNGFSIIELLTVVFIIGLLASITFINYQEVRGRLALNRAAHQLLQDLRKTQEMAMSSVQLNEAEGSCSLPLHLASLGNPLPLVPTDSKAKGYGIYINLSEDNKAYRLYADTSADSGLGCSTYPPDECWQYYNLGDCIYKTIFIQESGVIIKNIKNINIGGQKVSINFAAPNPDVNIAELQNTQDTVEIVLVLESDPDNPDKQRTIIVNRAGLLGMK